MRRARPFEPVAGTRLAVRRSEERDEWWTETVGQPPAVYGERWASFGPATFRSFEPARSKLAAALARGWDGPLPRPGESWLYLGGASGTTASHVGDLVGPDGAVYVVEKSVRPFARLVAVAERWPNLLPILDDARDPESYADLVGEVDGIYADISQPDQTGLVLRHAELYLPPRGGTVLLALKTPSLGRERGPGAHLTAAEDRLAARFDLDPSVRLDPFHRGHFFLGGRGGAVARPVRTTTEPRRARSGAPARPFRRRPGPPRGRSRR